MVLVKKNNFYFFDKGVQMRSKNSQNLFEKCFFSKTFSTKEVEASPKLSKFSALHTQKSELNEKQLETFKMKSNQRDSNKKFEDLEKIKQPVPIKFRLKKLNQLV